MFWAGIIFFKALRVAAIDSSSLCAGTIAQVSWGVILWTAKWSLVLASRFLRTHWAAGLKTPPRITTIKRKNIKSASFPNNAKTRIIFHEARRVFFCREELNLSKEARTNPMKAQKVKLKPISAKLPKTIQVILKPKTSTQNLSNQHHLMTLFIFLQRLGHDKFSSRGIC